MTTSDEYNRRASDKRIDELEANLRSMLDTAFRSHIGKLHIDLSKKEAEDKVREHDEMVASMERIVDLLEGEPVLDLQENVIGRKGGMAAKQATMATNISTIYERTNGGVKVTNRISPEWTRNQKIAAFSAGTIFVFAALPGFIGALRWVAELWVL